MEWFLSARYLYDGEGNLISKLGILKLDPSIEEVTFFKTVTMTCEYIDTYFLIFIHTDRAFKNPGSSL